MTEDSDEAFIRNDGYSNGSPPGAFRRPAAPASMTANPLTPERVAEIEKIVAQARAERRLPAYRTRKR
jgi:hypothetical protein